MKNKYNFSVQLMGLTLICVILVAALELISYIGIEFLIKPRANYLIYDPDSQNSTGYADYLVKRHPILGWPSPKGFGQEKRDLNGARRSPAYPQSGATCVSIYGDSFAWGDEVDDENAWPNLLSRRIACRVANFGVGGYGLDQAYLRYLNNTNDKSAVVVLTIFSENIQRHINQWRVLLTGSDVSFSLKPRFVLNAHNKIEIIPLPDLTLEEFNRMRYSPEDFLKHEYYLPATSNGPTYFRFPYTIALLKMLQNERVLTKLGGKPSFYPLYKADHDSQGLEVTKQIILSFYARALQENKQLYVVMIPSGSEVNHFLTTGHWVMQPLIQSISKHGFNVINFGQELINQGFNADHCMLRTHADKCRGHLNSEGSRLLADVMAKSLAKGDGGK